MAVVEQTGWGAEFDAGFANDDGGRTGGLNVQTYVMNLIGVWPKGQLRPFGTMGGGALRARTCTEACAGTIDWSDWAFSAGGGVQYVRNEIFGIRGDVRYFSNIGEPRARARRRAVLARLDGRDADLGGGLIASCARLTRAWRPAALEPRFLGAGS